MNVDFSVIDGHQRYKVMEVSSIHAGCGLVSAPQVCMFQQRFDPIVCDAWGRIAEQK